MQLCKSWRCTPPLPLLLPVSLPARLYVRVRAWGVNCLCNVHMFCYCIQLMSVACSYFSQRSNFVGKQSHCVLFHWLFRVNINV